MAKKAGRGYATLKSNSLSYKINIITRTVIKKPSWSAHPKLIKK